VYAKCGTLSRRAASRSWRFVLFQLALSLLGKVKMLLNHLGCVVRKLFHVGISPAVCFLLEFG
jgi:K+ transporter